MATAAPLQLASHIYKPLDASSKEIRLLEVAPGVADDIVTCTLKHVSLLDQRTSSYETISYSWGTSGLFSNIALNGQLVPVPHSSEAAVRRMRHRDRERILWIDAVCIDQSSLSERSQQVAMMSDIYKSARGNLVHFGEDDEGMAARAAENVHALASEMRMKTNDLAECGSLMYDSGSGLYLQDDQGFESPLDTDALQAVFSIPWFTRLWVLQEVVLAPSNTCHWGEVSFDLLEVVSAARWIAFKRSFVDYAVLAVRGWNCACIMFEKINLIFSKPYVLGDLLNITMICDKTEPRDGIYGLLGLLSVAHALPEYQPELLEVDYTKSVADIMCDATRYSLLESRDLRGIQYSFFPSAVEVHIDQDFPSWAVRADLQPRLHIILRLPRSHAADSGLQAPSMFGDLSQGHDMLLCQGFVVDRVSETTVANDADQRLGSRYLWLMSVKSLAMKTCAGKYGGNEAQVCTAIAFTIGAGRNKSGSRAHIDDVTMLVKLLEGLGPPPADDEERDKTFRAVSEETWRTLHDIMSPAFWLQRRFFATDKGSMGIGPTAMETGDLVAILRGGRLPMILRSSLRFRHVGSSYVHGIMNGEAVLDWKASGEPEKIFEIQ